MSELIRSGALSKDHLPDLRAMEVDEAERLAPVPPHGMVALLEALFQHYPAVPMSAEAQTQRWRDWGDDVSHLPTIVLAEACRKWRRSPEQYAPSPGLLLALVDDTYDVRLRTVRLAIRLLEKD